MNIRKINERPWRRSFALCALVFAASLAIGFNLFARPRFHQQPDQKPPQSQPQTQTQTPPQTQAQQAPWTAPPPTSPETPFSEWKEKLAPPDETKTAGEYYKNIQLLGDIPAPKLIATMKYYCRSLNVRCTHCHILGEFSRDDVPAKQQAREMIKLVASIGKEYFPGKSGPTCWTCHRGDVTPEFLPQPAQQPQPGSK